MNPLEGLSVSAERTLRVVNEVLQQKERSKIVEDGLIMSLCTRMEVYTDGIIDALIEASPISSFPLGRMLLGDVSGAYRFSWTERLRWLNTGFGVAVSGTRPVQEMITLTELRNAVTHGGGQLTWMQKRNFRKQLELEKQLVRVLAVDVEGSAIRYGERTINQAKEVVFAYVLKVDRETRKSYPHVVF